MTPNAKGQEEHYQVPNLALGLGKNWEGQCACELIISPSIINCMGISNQQAPHSSHKHDWNDVSNGGGEFRL